MQRAHDDLDDDEHGNEGDEEANAATVVDGTVEDAGVLAAHRDQEPGQGVGQDRHPGGQGEDDDADAHPGDVDAEGLREGAADATEDPVLGVAAEVLQPAGEVVAALVVMAVPASDPGVVLGPLAPAVAPPPASGRALPRWGRAATLLERSRAGIGRLIDASMVPRGPRPGYQGHP